MCTFSTFGAGFYTTLAYIQDRLMCSSCATISSMHSAEHACRDSTVMCSIHDFPYNTHHKKSRLQAAATIRERLICWHAVAKVWLLVESGFYSRAAFIQDCSVRYTTLLKLCIGEKVLSQLKRLFERKQYNDRTAGKTLEII